MVTAPWVDWVDSGSSRTAVGEAKLTERSCYHSLGLRYPVPRCCEGPCHLEVHEQHNLVLVKDDKRYLYNVQPKGTFGAIELPM